MSSVPLKEAIIDSFTQFFRKVAHQHPLKDDLLQNLSAFQQVILSDNSNYFNTRAFISSVYNKSQAKALQNSKSAQAVPSILSTLPTDTFLKVFTTDKQRYPFSLLTKFTYTSFKDYLIKNSISTGPEGGLITRYSHIRELLPDSQNFYRAIGLGLLEIFLSEPGCLPRIAEWYNRVFSREIVLSTQIYPFAPEELRTTFCGYIRQIIQTREENDDSREAKKARTLLYQMDSKDTVFDISLVSFIKEMILSKSDAETRIKSNDSAGLSDLLAEIPQIFNVNVVVQVIQNKGVCEVVYNVQGKDSKTVPSLHILNEKQLSYQNFCVLNSDSLEAEPAAPVAEKPSSGNHSRNGSLGRIPSNNSTFRLEKSFNSELKAASERIEKNLKPPQAGRQRGNLANILEDLSFQMRSLSDKPVKDIKSNPLKLGNEGNNSKLESDGALDKLALQEDRSPNNDVISLSKILGGYTDHGKQRNSNKSQQDLNAHQQQQQQDSFNNGDQSSKHDASSSAQKSGSLLKEKEEASMDAGVTPAVSQDQEPQVKSPINNETKRDSEGEPPQAITVNKLALQTREANSNGEKGDSGRAPNMKPALKLNIGSKAGEFEFPKPKIVTMVPKFMSTSPCNPFSSGNPMGGMSSGNPMSGGAPSGGYQPQDMSAISSKNAGKSAARPNVGNYGGQVKRFSLNPLGFLGPNGTKGSEGETNENFENGPEKKGNYKAYANMSMQACGQDLSEKRMY